MDSYTTQTLVGLVLILSCPFVYTSNVTQCIFQSPCACQTNQGLIDLASLSKSDPYAINDPMGNQKFYWDPCKDFQFSGITAGAIQNQLPDTAYDIGVHTNAGSLVSSDHHAQFYMLSSDYVKSIYVKCVCAGSVDITFDGESPENEYQFTLKAPNCCTGSVPGGGGSSGISAGSVMVIIFFTLMIVYFLVGFVFQMKVRKAEGKERVPNVYFWTALPGLIKDGFRFTFTCGKRSTTYESI